AAGFLMRRFDFPTAPVIIGMILGPLAETQFRRAMTIANGDWTVFYRHPLSLAYVRAAQQAGYRFNDDFNGERQEGVGFYQTTTANGERQSAAKVFLRPLAG
ncbi:GMC family oxidoreductase N-terminal domain-containing protein, partial [Mesorhizobium sp. M1C.F.Ca.ET.204.01.1.1]|uniref:GMC family oxidoreductase N-terminal domain-containing protein n=1 Tax=Mesorhizobium sp. M1C.F.Ca.ET.204.01.1.1 TaxID=2563929 RepID=UPI001675D99F